MDSDDSQEQERVRWVPVLQDSDNTSFIAGPTKDESFGPEFDKYPQT